MEIILCVISIILIGISYFIGNTISLLIGLILTILIWLKYFTYNVRLLKKEVAKENVRKIPRIAKRVH